MLHKNNIFYIERSLQFLNLNNIWGGVGGQICQMPTSLFGRGGGHFAGMPTVAEGRGGGVKNCENLPTS